MARKTITYDAAGGVVTRGDEVLLLIRPERDEVRLPKGHVDVGERPEEAALREVAEESGYADLEIVADLGTQLVAFTYRGTDYRRTEHYFLMRLRSPRRRPRPPEDEAQFIPTWVPWDEAEAALTFEAERIWLRRARALQGGDDDGR